MSVNRHRGEVEAIFDGKPYKLCLTLGALAELEDAFAATDLTTLVERFSTGRLSASDLVTVIGAGLRGAGHDMTDQQVRALRPDRGVAGFAAVAAELLTVTFGGVPKDDSRRP
jgi:hypothetical protein